MRTTRMMWVESTWRTLRIRLRKLVVGHQSVVVTLSMYIVVCLCWNPRSKSAGTAQAWIPTCGFSHRNRPNVMSNQRSLCLYQQKSQKEKPSYLNSTSKTRIDTKTDFTVAKNGDATVKQTRYPKSNLNQTLSGSSSTTTTNNQGNKVEVRLSDMNGRDQRGEKLTQAYCDSVLGLCVASDKWENVLDVLDIMKRQGLSQQRSTYRACLQACFEVGNGASAREILRAMEQALVQPEAIDISLAVAAMCRNDKTEPGWWRRALALLRMTADPPIGSRKIDGVVPVEAYDAVLSCMAGEQQWREALHLLNQMERGGGSPQSEPRHPQPVLSTYRVVIEACVAAQQAEQAVQLLLAVVNKGIKPTAYTFELVIGALAKKLQWRRALQLLDVMDENSVPMTVVTYNTVISACARAGEVGMAKSLLVKMRKQGITPNTISFNSVMSACASTSRWRDALSILDQIHREPGVMPDIITYTSAMRACAKGGKIRRALTLLDVVKEKGLPLDNYCYAAVIDACAKANMWQKALELLDEMKKNGIAPNHIIFSVAITACGNGGQWRKALDLLDEMRSNGMPVNLRTYNALMAALSKAARRNAKYASKLHAPQRFPPDAPLYGSMENETVDMDEEQLWTRAMDLLRQMEDDGIEPDGFSYSSAISCCGAGGRWKEALKLIKVMRKGGPKTRPNKIAYTAAIAACGRSGENEHAIELFREMKDEGHQPDRVAYNALFTALRIGHLPDAAYELWREIRGKTQTSSRARIATASGDKFLSPDIVTLTDVVATLSRSNRPIDIERMDQVFAEAVELGIVLRGNLNSLWEVDVSGMSFPVCRAALRFIFAKALSSVRQGETPQSITLITGVGRFRTVGTQQTLTDDSSASSATALSLRDYVQNLLREEFHPPLNTTVPIRAQGTVLIESDTVAQWLAQN